MTSTYNVLADYVEGDPLPADEYNELIHNVDFLRNPPRYFYSRPVAGSDYTTAASSMTDMDGTNLNTTLTTQGGLVRIELLIGRLALNSAGNVCIDFVVDGSSLAGNTNGVWNHVFAANAFTGPNIRRYVQLNAGSHSFKVQWKVSAGTATITVANLVQFLVQE